MNIDCSSCRNSLGRTPKIKNAPSKESVTSAAVVKDNASVGHRLSTGDASSKISVVDLAASPVAYFTRAAHREQTFASIATVAVSVLQEKSLNLSPRANDVDKVIVDNQLAKESDCSVKLQPEVVRQQIPSNTTKVCSMRRTRSKMQARSNDENDDGQAEKEEDTDASAKTPPTYHFRRPASGGSTLRRGRPNTVRSGLPVPASSDTSTFKSSKTHPMPCDSPCPLLVDVDVDPIDESKPLSMTPLTSLNNDHGKSFLSTRRKSRRSISLTDIFQSAGRSVEVSDPNLSNSYDQLQGFAAGANSTEDVFSLDDEPSRSAESGVSWKSAAVVLRDIRTRDNVEIEAHGRPSLVRLKKEKAGMVSMSVKLYNDAIARKVTEPVPEMTGDRSLRIASPVRIPPIFTAAKLRSQSRLSNSPAPSSNSSNRRKTTVSQKPKSRQTKNSSTPTTSGSSTGNVVGRPRRRLVSQSSCQSPKLTEATSRFLPRATAAPVSQRKAAVRRSPRLHHHSDDSLSSVKVKAASDAYRRRAIRGQIKRRSTVL